MMITLGQKKEYEQTLKATIDLIKAQSNELVSKIEGMKINIVPMGNSDFIIEDRNWNNCIDKVLETLKELVEEKV